MSAFDTAVQHTLQLEGVFSNHSWDPGGKTKYGITEKLALAYGYSDIEGLLVIEATDIYRREFWLELKLDKLSHTSVDVATEIFDTAVNTGKTRAVRIVQEALSIVFDEDIQVDGKLGPITTRILRRVSRKYEHQLVAALNGFQFTYYIWLLRRSHPAAKRSIKGWMRRLG